MVADTVRVAAQAVVQARVNGQPKRGKPCRGLASFFACGTSRAKKSPRGARGLKGCSLGAGITIGGRL